MMYFEKAGEMKGAILTKIKNRVGSLVLKIKPCRMSMFLHCCN